MVFVVVAAAVLPPTVCPYVVDEQPPLIPLGTTRLPTAVPSPSLVMENFSIGLA